MPTGTHSSPAVQILNRHGVRVKDVAVIAGTTPATVSRWLAGRINAPEELSDVLRKFLDPETVDDVLDAVAVSFRVAVEREAQGLPATVTDPKTLARIAAVAGREVMAG